MSPQKEGDGAGRRAGARERGREREEREGGRGRGREKREWEGDEIGGGGGGWRVTLTDKPPLRWWTINPSTDSHGGPLVPTHQPWYQGPQLPSVGATDSHHLQRRCQQTSTPPPPLTRTHTHPSSR